MCFGAELTYQFSWPICNWWQLCIDACWCASIKIPPSFNTMRPHLKWNLSVCGNASVELFSSCRKCTSELFRVGIERCFERGPGHYLIHSPFVDIWFCGICMNPTERNLYWQLHVIDESGGNFIYFQSIKFTAVANNDTCFK